MKYIVFTLTLLMSSWMMQGQAIERVWATNKVLSTPESVLYDGQTNRIYISNINGKPAAKDGNGFISLMDTTGKIISLKWVTGLDAPKGMAISGDMLYVSDIDKVRLISLREAKVIETVEVAGSSFLNDVVVTPDGSVYITDTQENKIFRIKDGKAEIWLEDDLLVSPNGLALFKDHNLAVGVKNSVLKVIMKSKNVKVLIDETGPVDGLIYLSNNKFIISNWAGRVMIASPAEKVVLYSKTDHNVQTADLGFIRDRNIVLVPTFYDNRVIASRIIKLNTE